ncbi:MAG: 5-formyltetrahydrofolate cyclo-ligase [Magnetococcus sp. WYHC-3]
MADIHRPLPLAPVFPRCASPGLSAGPGSVMDRVAIRQALLARRRSLSLAEVARRSRALCAHAVPHPDFQHASTVALYLPVQGEADPLGLLEQLPRLRGQCFLPAVVARGEPLQLCSWSAGSPLEPGAFGIPVPRQPQLVLTPRDLGMLDLMVLPLVAWNRQGLRLGYGGGYYDRTLAGVHTLSRRPALWGWAYDFQEVPQLGAEPHDIPLDGVVCESGAWRFSPSGAA